jgi:tetratricopeptide (TPR) repeat protein
MILRILFLFFVFVVTSLGGDFNALYRSGLRKVNAADYDGALTDFKAAFRDAQKVDEKVKILFLIADIYSSQNNYKDAKHWTRRVFDIANLAGKDKITAYQRLVNYSIHLKRYDDALESINKALKIVKTNKTKALFLSDRAKIFELQKAYSKAIDSWHDYIKLCENDSSQLQLASRQIIVLLFKQKKYKDILEFIGGLKLDKWEKSSQIMIYYYAGLSTFKEKDYVLAISFFERMPDKGPKWLFYSKNSKLGSSWKQLVKYEKAYQCFELIYKDKKLANFYRASSLWEMANLRYLQKKYKDCELLCEQLIKFSQASKSQIKRAKERILLIKNKD